MTKRRTDRKPPLPKSPIRVRSRGVLRPSISNNTAQTQTQTQSVSSMKPKSMDLEILSNYDTISCELRKMAKMEDSGEFAIPLFKRGKYYDEYSARRNERLMMKQLDSETVLFESPEKKRDLKKCKEKKSLIPVPRTPLTARRENINPNPNPNQNPKPRYLLRSMTKEMKKPASLLPLDPTSSVGGERKTASRRLRKI